MKGDPIGRSVDEHLANLFTPSGPCSGSTPELASGNSELCPPSSQEPPPITADLCEPSPFGASQVATSSDLILLRGNTPDQYSYDYNSTATLVSSLVFPKVPPKLHVPLSFLGEPGLQVSRTTPRELEMSL